ncbi:hypothetical protein D6D21_03435 [Aureobasidium pullulans]|uniref:BTB domain-containing protein n=1 Tax=Aureobasidium pullulans TaxID=5580 RepID=A0AB74J2X5_AURPU|nr:hypothetical protein D6D21_03435 [Aureobasidium pullulans]
MTIGSFGLLSVTALKTIKAAFSGPQNSRIDLAMGVISPALPVITIRSGRDKDTTDFGIHKNVLEHRSPYFKALLQADKPIKSEEAMDNKVETIFHLKEDPAACKLYIEWIYSGYIWQRPQSPDLAIEGFETLVKAYILGEKLLDHKFQNAIIDSLLARVTSEGRLALTLPTIIYNGTKPTSPIRRLLVDLYLWYGHKDWLTKEVVGDHSHTLFTTDLSIALLERQSQSPLIKDRCPVFDHCRYHDHAGEKSCVAGETTLHPWETEQKGF